MLAPASWLDAARETPLGRSRRLDHDCGGGRTLVVDNKPDAWTAWCHRCSDKGFEPKPAPSLAERVAKLRAVTAVDDEAERDPRPPMPADFDPSGWPLPARVWLYRAGLSNDRIRELGFYWNARLQRVVMPLLDGPRVAYWQARGFDNERPKYINPKVDKPLFRVGSGPLLVLTEDMLSAVRVGAVTEAWSILGTSLTEQSLGEIMRAGKPVRVWLDPDGAGERGRRKIVARLRAFGIDASAVRSDRDPKLHSSEEIASAIELVRHLQLRGGADHHARRVPHVGSIPALPGETWR